MNFNYQRMDSPVGPLILVAKNEKLRAVWFERRWEDFKTRYENLIETETPVLKEAKRQLQDYFSGKNRSFDLPIELEGTEFQKKVWMALKKIPFGQTKTYKEQALLINAPKAIRAVGGANGMNPLSIVLPCHRVIGADRSLTGYGGGLPIKKFLLELEGFK